MLEPEQSLRGLPAAEREWRIKKQEREDRYMSLFRHVNTLAGNEPGFLIDGFLPLGYCVILAGDPKVGKTALASAMAVAVAEGSAFAGMSVQMGGVLWLALEESPEERATVMAPVRERLENAPFYITYSKVSIDTDEDIEHIRAWIQDVGAKLVVVDPLHGAHSGRSLNDGWSARRTLAAFKHLCARTAVTGLVLHHIGRRHQRVAENAQLAACAGMSLLLTARDVDGERILTLRGQGRGDFTNRTWHFASSDPLDYRPSEPPPPQPREPRADQATPATRPLDDQVLARIEGSPKPVCASEIAAQLGRNPNSIRNSLARLSASQRVTQVHIHPTTRYYRSSIKPAESESKLE